MEYKKKHHVFMCFRTAVLPLMLFCCAVSEASTLEQRIDSILDDKEMTVGVAVEYGDFRYVRNDSVCFPLMSVFKVHVAMTVLYELESNSVPLDSVVRIDKSRMLRNTYSPLRDRYPEQDIDIRIDSLIYYSVAESDNNACDILIEMAGGIDRVDLYARTEGVSGFSLTETESTMHDDIRKCYENWSHPSSMNGLMKKLYEDSDSTYSILRKVMLSTSTGANKIKAGLPDGTVVAHKTGSSDRLNGVKIGDNDAAVIMLPEGKCYMTVFIKDSKETDEVNASVISGITREALAEINKRQ